jgi:hypothetical protein
MNTSSAEPTAAKAAESLAFANAEQTLLDAGMAFSPVAHCALESCAVCVDQVLRRAA